MVDDVGQLISARSWMRRDEKPSPTLQNQLVSYTLNLSFGHTAWNTEIKPVIYQVHLADFTLNVGSPVHRLIGYEGSLLFWIYSIYAARVWCWQLVRYHSRRDGGMGTCVLIYYIYIWVSREKESFGHIIKGVFTSWLVVMKSSLALLKHVVWLGVELVLG